MSYQPEIKKKNANNTILTDDSHECLKNAETASQYGKDCRNPKNSGNNKLSLRPKNAMKKKAIDL